MNTWFIRKMGRRTSIQRAAYLYSKCLQLAVQDALKRLKEAKKPMILADDDVREALRGAAVRQYLIEQKDTIAVRDIAVVLIYSDRIIV